MSKHGRAVMPWGKYRGVRLRLVPDDYLSWLTTTTILKADRWKWLRDSLLAELKFRGFNMEKVSEADVETETFPGDTPVIRRKFRPEMED